MGTQADLRDDPSVRDKLAKQRMQPVRKEDGERMAKELGAVKYVECSALTQYKLKDVFDEVCPFSPLGPRIPLPGLNAAIITGNRRCAGAASNFRQRQKESRRDKEALQVSYLVSMMLGCNSIIGVPALSR